MLVNGKELLNNALKGKYALGAFNFVNLETLKAVLDAAQSSNSPVIIQSSVGAIKYANVQVLSAMVKALAGPLSIPVCWNLDHGKTFEDCKMAIDNGFTNVMIDASDLPFDENVALTKRVVDYAHARGVSVEAELGTLRGVEDEVNVSEENAFYTVPAEAARFVALTGVDSLAIAIGTSHGAYKFSGDGSLRFDILSQIETLLPQTPLVLHGASSIPQHVVEKANTFGANIKGANGVPENLLEIACTKHNICKVNVDSDLRISFLAGIRQDLAQNPSNIDIRSYLSRGSKEIEAVVTHKLTNIFHSANKA